MGVNGSTRGWILVVLMFCEIIIMTTQVSLPEGRNKNVSESFRKKHHFGPFCHTQTNKL